jgi:hypothetical protein
MKKSKKSQKNKNCQNEFNLILKKSILPCSREVPRRFRAAISSTPEKEKN